MPLVLSDKNFKARVLESPVPVLVDFWAPWCAPCHVIAPVVEAIDRDYEGRLVVGKLNVDENPQTTQSFQVRSIPTLKIFKQGKIVGEIVGAAGRQEITREIEKHL